MAMALRFDGVNDWAEFSSPRAFHDQLGLTVWEYEFQAVLYSDSPSLRVVGNSTDYSSYVTVSVDQVLVRYYSTTVVIPTTSSPFNDVSVNIKIQRNGNDYTILYDNNPVGNLNSSTAAGGGSVKAVCRVVNDYSKLDFEFLKFKKVIGGTPVHEWVADDADHSNNGLDPKMIDPYYSVELTGRGMPTDGTAWVDLGGGEPVIELTVINAEQVNNAAVLTTQQWQQLSMLNAEQVNNAAVLTMQQWQQLSMLNAEQVNEAAVLNIETFGELILSVVNAEQVSQADVLTSSQVFQTTSINAEQISQASIVEISDTIQLLIVPAEQVTEAAVLNIETFGELVLTVNDAELTSEADVLSLQQWQQLAMISAEQINEAEILGSVVKIKVTHAKITQIRYTAIIT